MLLLLASLAALVVGPVAGVALERAPKVKAAFEWVVVAGLLALILLHVLPEAVELARLWVIPVAAASVGATLLLERWGSVARGSDNLVFALGVLALGVHSALDGAALASADGPGAARGLAVAVVLHRVPTSMAIWWLVQRNLGVRWAVAMVAWDGATTLLGYFGEGALFAHASPMVLGLLQAVIAGSLLHVAFHVRGHGHGHAAARSAAG